jgi:membrane protease YdiL (CAAX protease family)
MVCPACDGNHCGCAQCAALMNVDASFCPRCGKATPEKLKVEHQRVRTGLLEKEQAAKAIPLVFLGVLFALIYSAPGDVVHQNAVFLVVGLLALKLLGKSAWRKSLAGGTTLGYLGLGLLAAVPSFLISYLYVSALPRGEPGDGSATVAFSWTMLVAFCVLPSLMEEWLCRGVLWEAVRRMASPGNTILLTSILFAMMHGLGGGWTLEFPHRFVAGLIFGWLRLKSGSLLPGMLAHFVHNTLALTV